VHELGIAQGILEIVRQYVPEAQAGEVRAIKMRVGEMSGVVPDSLDFCFGAIVADTAYRGAFLAIERVATRCRCGACGREFSVDHPAFVCPDCGSPRVTLVAGSELQVVEVELAEARAEAP